MVDAFLEIMGTSDPVALAGHEIGTNALRPGMVLARDLVGKDGVMLLLAADFVLDENLIRQLRELEASEGSASPSPSARPRAPEPPGRQGRRAAVWAQRRRWGSTAAPPASSCSSLARHRAGEQVALDKVAAPLPQDFQLGRCLHALDHHVHPQAAGEADHRLDNRQALAVVELANEAAVDLEGVLASRRR